MNPTSYQTKVDIEDFTGVVISYDETRRSAVIYHMTRFKLDFIVLKVDYFNRKQRCHGRRYDVTCTRQNVM